MKNSILRGILVLTMAMILQSPRPSLAKTDENPSRERTIKVEGEGKVWAVPDQAEMEVEVQEEGQDIDELSSLAQTKMEKIFNAVKSIGIPEKDIQSTTYNVQPKVRYYKGETQKEGYIVSHKIRVVIKNVDSAGKVLNEVLKDGATNVNGPNSSFSDPAKLKIEALKSAVDDAHAKAEAMAQSAGVGVGPVYSITQINVSMPYRPAGRVMSGLAASAEGAEVSLATGQNEVTAQVEVIYSLK